MSGNRPSESLRDAWLRAFTRDPINLFTLALVAATVFLGVMAVSAERTAKRAADAAQQSADTARRALIAGQRAFVSVTYNKYPNRDPVSDQINGWAFSVHWRNAGDTPTRNLVNHTNILVSDTEVPPAWGFPDDWGNTPPDKRHGIPLGAAPRAAVESDMHYITLAEAEAATAGKKFIYLWGWATYNDVFPNTPLHVTRFAVQIAMTGDARNADRVSVRFPFLPRYNCSDEECDHQGFPANWMPRANE